MNDRKRRVIRLLEFYLNEFRSDAVQEMYGVGSKIKVHDLLYSTNSNSLMLEAVIILGDVINEDVMDRKLADILIQDALVYFYPDKNIKAYVRFDV